MCRNIKILFNFEPPVTDDEIEAAALQFVRKVSGMRRPSQANQEVFDAAVADVCASTRKLLGHLRTQSPPRSREDAARAARERGRKREERLRARLLAEQRHDPDALR